MFIGEGQNAALLLAKQQAAGMISSIASTDARFFPQDEPSDIWSLGPSIGDRRTKPWYPPSLEVLAAESFVSGALLEWTGRKTKVKGFSSLGRLLMGLGGVAGGYSWYEAGRLSAANERRPAMTQIAVPQVLDVPAVTTEPQDAASASLPTGSPTQATELSTPLPVETPTAIPWPNPWPEYLVCAPEVCRQGVANYQVWQHGEQLAGYTHETGIGPVLDVVIDTVTMPSAKDSWNHAQFYGAWPYEFGTKKNTRLTVSCDQVCLVYVVSPTGEILESFTDSNRVDETLPTGVYDKAWVVVVPADRSSELTQVHLHAAAIDEPRVILPNQINPETGQLVKEPTISGITLEPVSDEEAAARLGKIQVAIGTGSGPSVNQWIDPITTKDGGTQVKVPIDRAALGLFAGDPVTAKIIVPLPMDAGDHDVKVNCDDHCHISFVPNYQYILEDIEFTLSNSQAPSTDREWTVGSDGSWMTQAHLGAPTSWVIIDLDDAYGGAAVDVTVY